MKSDIAIVGMACRFPDAQNPTELWENVLSGRRAFRRLPPERLSSDDYVCSDTSQPDTTYADQAAVIEGYEFDRQRFRVAGSTFRQADMAHWLALNMAADALVDSGFPDGEGIPKESTAVLIGNSLTGEFSRANLMRLRWPYVRRVVDAALDERQWTTDQRSEFLADLERQYKSPFPSVGDETLAGGLSNTIAGRVCNFFDFRGGGYTVDGACASSLLAVANACTALTVGDVDVVLAGGVDLSLDPFELLGFAKLGALADREMRVYDRRSNGFWPGEGCGIVVLMRAMDAVEQNRRIYATIRGWGISSDGNGGITRPEVEGQKLAMSRAYRRAGFGIGEVGYFEGHGTGTNVGDATELQAVIDLRRKTAPNRPPAAIGSVKANIGHTKAAAGVAGLIKATMALYEQLVPPNSGVSEPHPELTKRGQPPMLEVLARAKRWPVDQPMRAAVSAMGFGGINAHLVLQAAERRRRSVISARQKTLLASAQDAELFLFSAPDHTTLAKKIDRIASYAGRTSRSELADLAAQLWRDLKPGSVRAAVVADDAAELRDGLQTLSGWLKEGVTDRLDLPRAVALGSGWRRPSIGYLFPGQGSPAYRTGGLWRRRFADVDQLYEIARLPAQGDAVATEIAQPAIVSAALAGLRVLDRLEIDANVAVGHSLGELVAYHWAGAMDESSLLRLTTARGEALVEGGSFGGSMASIAAGPDVVARWVDGKSCVIAGLNSPLQTVISGEVIAVDEVVAQAAAAGYRTVPLRVSHAFHSPLMAEAVGPLRRALQKETLVPTQRRVVSTITGAYLDRDEDLSDLLLRQLTSPVRLTDAMRAAGEGVDLWVEVGPGSVMRGIVSTLVDQPVVSLDSGSDSLRGLLQAVACLYSLGACANLRFLFDERFTRPFDLDWNPRFFANPCEAAPSGRAPTRSSAAAQVGQAMLPVADTTDRNVVPATGAHGAQSLAAGRTETLLDLPEPTDLSPKSEAPADEPSALELVRSLISERVELPVEAVKENDRLLSDLHMTSIAVGQIVADASRTLKLPPPAAPSDYANATVAEVAAALDQLVSTGAADCEPTFETIPAGVDNWVRAFHVQWVERPLSATLARRTGPGAWQIMGESNDPLVQRLRVSFETDVAGNGVVVCLPPDLDERHVQRLLTGAKAAIEGTEARRFVLVNRGRGGAALARTLYLENPHVNTCVVNVPVEHPGADAWIVAEAQTAAGYTEASYDAAGVRRVPLLRLAAQADPEGNGDEMPALGPNDVLLVTGGGKGIAAECALMLAQKTGVGLGLLGRSLPADDAELARNLQRMEQQNVTWHYVSTDVADSEAVQSAVESIENMLGPITAVLHGAGTNEPKLLQSLQPADFHRTLAPKVHGLSNVLAAIDPQRLRLLVTFGSIIARTGMPGEADYALANDWLTSATEAWQVDHPHCRCLAIEWSVWSGVGMGERLGRIDALKQQGIMPISPDTGIQVFLQLLQRTLPLVAVVVTGRFGEPRTLRLDRPALPLYRFLELPRVVIPGVELVADARLTHDSDPYLIEHTFQDSPLLPAVMGLEGMAQITLALTGSAISDTIEFEKVELARPVVVPRGSQTTIRLAGLVRKPGQVEVVLRSEETDFQVDHFRAVCRVRVPELSIAGRAGPTNGSAIAANWMNGSHRVPLDPQRDLYGDILFHRGRFQRVQGYRFLRATECLAEIEADAAPEWFHAYLPPRLVLGDAAMRDAIIHAIQACIPHGTILPTGVDKLTISGQRTSGRCVVHARERSHVENEFVYDVDVADERGHLVERWEGLQLRRVGQVSFAGSWSPGLLGPYLERRMRELVPDSSASIVVLRNGQPDRAASDHAIEHALGRSAEIHRRPDGKPVASGQAEVSVSHAGILTMAVAGPGCVACDLEPIGPRSSEQAFMLLGQRYPLAERIAEETAEAIETAVTRVWAASECLKKSGMELDLPLVIRTMAPGGWVVLGAGDTSVVTWIANVQGVKAPLALAVLNGKGTQVSFAPTARSLLGTRES